jgi:hypothetical protein
MSRHLPCGHRRLLLTQCRAFTGAMRRVPPGTARFTLRQIAPPSPPSSELEHDRHPLDVKLSKTRVVLRRRCPGALCIIDRSHCRSKIIKGIQPGVPSLAQHLLSLILAVHAELILADTAPGQSGWRLAVDNPPARTGAAARRTARRPLKPATVPVGRRHTQIAAKPYNAGSGAIVRPRKRDYCFRTIIMRARRRGFYSAFYQAGGFLPNWNARHHRRTTAMPEPATWAMMSLGS